jgi:alpha,alpha-trehalase
MSVNTTERINFSPFAPTLERPLDGSGPEPNTYNLAPLPPLRPPVPVEPVKPLDVAPNPGAMGQLYIDLRKYYPDGMSLACAEPRPPYTYKGIVKSYEEESKQPGFEPIIFWNKCFTMPEPDNQVLVAEKGMKLGKYLKKIRPNFILDNVENSSFDIRLPYRRSVAGAGRFSRHSFLWDGYQMGKGYEADNEWGLILNIADNYEYQINKYGYVLNGSAEFYVTRSQPPYFSNLVSMIAEKYGNEALVRYLPAMEKEYLGYWMDGEDSLHESPDDGQVYAHRTLVRVPLADGTYGYVNRYWDDADGPRLESYKEDVDLAELVTHGLLGTAKERRAAKLYRDVRAAAASGWDFSSRWFEDGRSLETISTTDVLPVDLNSLLARTEQVIARAYFAAGNTDKALSYLERAEKRMDAINTLMWDSKDRIYRDYNFVQGGQTKIVSAAMAYPLYAGIASLDQALGVADAIENDLLFIGGIIATTTADSEQQWDGGKRRRGIRKVGKAKGQMNVWAPPNWAAARGLARIAYMVQAAQDNTDPWLTLLGRRQAHWHSSRPNTEAAVERLLSLSEKIKANYMDGIQTVYKAHGMVTEKHRGDRPAVLAGGGEYELVKVLAMPCETYRAFQEWNPRDPDGCLPIGRIALGSAAK